MSNASRITPRTLKGFRDYLPGPMIARQRLIDTAREVYSRYGFAPIDTPALEYYEILAGKGGEETTKQMFRFEHGRRDVAMRFDLTVPLARFVAQHAAQLGMPFKRYHIGPVWRGEKPQEGRYREFVQCDFDTIGTTSIVSDIETALVIHDLLLALGVDDFTICINHRQVLSGLLELRGLQEQSGAVLRSLDKLPKIGRDKVLAEMTATASIPEADAQEVLRLADIQGDHDQVLSQVGALVKGNATGEAGVAALEGVIRGVAAGGAAPKRFKLDVAIARGLDYYTGTVYETFLGELPGIGSVCSGGRYDNLAGLYTKQELPGVGASLGLDRLLAALEKLGRIESKATAAPVLVTYFDREALPAYLKIAAQLRAASIAVELYPEPKKLGQQLKYADSRGFRVAVIAGSRELESGVCQIKDLVSGESQEIALEPQGAPIVQAITKLLAGETA